MRLHVLEEYIETGNHHDLDLLLSHDPDLVTQSTSHQISPLLLSCYYHKAQITQTILKYTKTITIHEACAVGLKQHVEMMLDYKKEIKDELSTHGFTPLGIAAHFGQEEIIRVLLENQADPNIPCNNGYHVFPLHAAVSSNNTGISKLLIDAGAEVNVFQKGHIAPIHLAAQHGNLDLIILLLEHGADIKVVTEQGHTATSLAAEKGFRELSEILKFN